jgi:hypothetical protein
MKKINFICFVLLVNMLFLNNFEWLNASETRTFSMGQVGNYIRDNSNVYPFPGTLMDYNNQIIMELRTYKNQPDQYFGGVHLPLLSTNYMIGVYLNRPLDFDFPSIVIGDGLVELEHTTDVLFGMKMGNNNLGFRLSYASDGYQQDSSFADPRNIEESAQYIELAAGLSSEIYDAGLSLHLPSINSEIDGSTDEWGGYGIGVNGRYFYKINEKMTCVPMVSIGTLSSERKIEVTDVKNKYEIFSLVLGVSLNYQIEEQTLLLLGIEPFGYLSSSEDIENVGKTTDKTTTLPAIFIGAESNLKTWLIGRCGIRQSFQSMTTTYEPDVGAESEISESTSDINFTFGFGIRVGSLLMDVDFNQSMFFDGPQFISGQSNQMFNRISLTYSF